MANVAHLPDDVTFDPVREILKVGETEFSLAFLRFFNKRNDGALFKMTYDEQGVKIERVTP